MKTVAKLRFLGFRITAAENAVGCTEVKLAIPFFYFNPKFCAGPEQVMEHLHAAAPTGVGNWHGFVLAGDHHSDGDAEFPYVIVSADQQRMLAASHLRMVEAREQERQAHAELQRLVATYLPDTPFGG